MFAVILRRFIQSRKNRGEHPSSHHCWCRQSLPLAAPMIRPGTVSYYNVGRRQKVAPFSRAKLLFKTRHISNAYCVCEHVGSEISNVIRSDCFTFSSRGSCCQPTTTKKVFSQWWEFRGLTSPEIFVRRQLASVLRASFGVRLGVECVVC